MLLHLLFTYWPALAFLGFVIAFVLFLDERRTYERMRRREIALRRKWELDTAYFNRYF
jgi:hypothetical protein